MRDDLVKALRSLMKQTAAGLKRMAAKSTILFYGAAYVCSLITVKNAPIWTEKQVGGAIALIVILAILGRISKEYALVVNQYNSIPIPRKRFTERKGEEVEMNVERVEELLLYVNELEQWLSDRGMIEK